MPNSSPSTSTINFAAGQIRGNGLTVALGAGGTLSATYMGNPGATTDLVFDVTGYFTPDATGATYHAVTPVRLVDTRGAVGLPGRLSANSPQTFAVAGTNGIPANATAVTGNVTAVNQTNGWAVYLGPISTATPTTSTVNFVKGEVAGNNLTVALAAGGRLSTTFMSTPGNTTDLVFDVTGYYTPDATGSMFVPMNPARLLDTRAGIGLSGKLAANSPRPFQVIGRGGLPANTVAVTGNVTVVNQSNSWAAYLGPSSDASPGNLEHQLRRGRREGQRLDRGPGIGTAVRDLHVHVGPGGGPRLRRNGLLPGADVLRAVRGRRRPVRVGLTTLPVGTAAANSCPNSVDGRTIWVVRSAPLRDPGRIEGR